MKLFFNLMVSIGLFAPSVSALSADATQLKPPRGAEVAIVMFEDLQCADCSKTHPVVWETANAHKIPVVLHDFPLPMHNWAFEAAVWARCFDKASTDLGNEFRKFIYANQTQVTRDNLLQWAQKFAGENKIDVPSEKDPDGKLADLVKADYLLGQRIGVEHTPTIWVVSNSGVSQPLVEEVKVREKLEQMISDVLNKAQPVASAKVNFPGQGSSAQEELLAKSQRRQDNQQNEDIGKTFYFYRRRARPCACSNGFTRGRRFTIQAAGGRTRGHRDV